MLRSLLAPTVEPITLEQAKAHLRVTTSNEDALITALITSARVSAEHELQRSLIQQDWELTLDEFPDSIELLKPPVIGVVSINYINAAGVSTLLDPTLYYVDTKNEPGYVMPSAGNEWPDTPDDTINTVTVVYRCGYGTSGASVPAPILSWMLLHIGALFENRESVVATPGVSQVVLGFVDHLLDPYRVIIF